MKLNPKNVKEIVAQFKKQMENVPNLLFGYICGSFARKEMSSTSDIDFLICTRGKISKKVVGSFRKWYYSIHFQFHLFPDREYPGEIMNISKLDEALDRLELSRVLYIVSKKSILFDGLVWSGMLSGAKLGFIGDGHEYRKRRKIAKQILHRWRNLTKVADDLYLKKFIKMSE